MLLTRNNPSDGEETLPYKFIVTRHMPSVSNPYGKALFSSCFWPYTFKHGGWKFFYKFCERFGLPWPVGKYPQGTPPKEQNELLDALIQMMDDGAATIPDGDQIQLLSVNSSGELAQEALIHLCNREMSKVLTSQTLATEMKNVGSNAASKTHDDRQGRVQHSDRNIVAESFNQIFRYITLFNFGPDVAVPRFEFFKAKEVSKERAETWEIASRIGTPSKQAFHEEMNIPMATSEDDVLGQAKTPAAEFSQGQSAGQHEFTEAENALLTASQQAFDASVEAQFIAPVVALMDEYEREGKTLSEFQEALPSVLGELEQNEAQSVLADAMVLAALRGMEAV